MTSLIFTIPGKPVSVNSAWSPAPGARRMFKNPEARTYAALATAYAFKARKGAPTYLGPIVVAMRVVFPNKRGDLDNALKAVIDALQAAKVIKNDSQVQRIVADREIDKAKPRVEVAVHAYIGPQAHELEE